MILFAAGVAWFAGWSAAAIRQGLRAVREGRADRSGTAFGLLVRGSLAKRADFTDEGWQLRSQAATFQWVGFLGFAAALLATAWM
jgi:hypothetical protein